MSVNTDPLVSVICICYNHANYVVEAIDSVLAQDYPNIELIVIDDASSDGSGKIIKEKCVKARVKYLLNSENLGNCASFNKAYGLSSGEFVIDLAADDMLLPQRASIGVKILTSKGPDYGVHYSDALIVNKIGIELGLHTQITKTINSGEILPEGDVFHEVLERYFVCPPTIMARKEVFDNLGGYDESLSFEDFDFLVRASRTYKFCYSPDVLVKRRILSDSKSSLQYKKGSKDLWSVLAVCQKAFPLIQDEKEKKALSTRLQYECRQVIIHNEQELVKGYLDLMKKNGMSWVGRELYRITGQIYPKIFG